MPTIPSPPVLEAVQLSKRFRARRTLLDTVRRRRNWLTALDQVSLAIEPHQIVGVVGESGSGKSTLAKCLVRLQDPDAGEVRFGGEDVLAAKGSDLAAIRRRMQMIYQDPYSSLNPLMKVEDAITEPGHVHGLIPAGESAADYAKRLLDLVGLPAAAGARRPSQLSGGQRQRVAIARAMAAEPELIIADEPVSALDVSIQAQILNLFEKLRAEEGLSVLFIAHQLPVVAHMADTVLVMYLGRVVERGPARAVFGRPGHPYTAGLLESQPGRHRRQTSRRPALKGEIPSPLEIPSGCRFRTRCPLAQEVCREVDPPAADLGDGQLSWCHFPERVGSRAAAKEAVG
jgi:oligopeptide/dipeptide ABC transporter ATP-binding protein